MSIYMYKCVYLHRVHMLACAMLIPKVSCASVRNMEGKGGTMIAVCKRACVYICSPFSTVLMYFDTCRGNVNVCFLMSIKLI